MPESSSGEERTEPATPKKRRESREEGQVAKSREVSSVIILTAGLLGIYFFARFMSDRLGLFGMDLFGSAEAYGTDGQALVSLIYHTSMQTAIILLPFLLLMAVSQVASGALQYGFLFSPKSIMPKGERIDPIAGAKRLLSWRGVVELGKSIFKLGILFYICYDLIRRESGAIAGAMELETGPMTLLFADLLTKLLLRCLIFLVILAVLDYGFQKWQHEEQLKMTHTEVKQEMKQMEGDPLVKARIRAIQRERARQRMMEQVPKSDVVITNPTHFAVALQYDMDAMPAPQVVAKGKNLIAQRIRELAEENQVAIVQDPPLARTLYAAVDVGGFIPENLYQAVAEVLSFVYQAGKQNPKFKMQNSE